MEEGSVIRLSNLKEQQQTAQNYARNWGSVRIRVSSAAGIKPKKMHPKPEERLFSVMRYIALGIAQHSRWYPVFQRYLQQIAGRVIGLGGDPGKMLPSPTSQPPNTRIQ